MCKFFWIACLGICLLSASCATTERSTIYSAGYWKRHFAQIADDFHQFRVDIDRTIFDLDDRPIEDQ